MADQLIISAYALSTTGKSLNLDNMYVNGRYVNVGSDSTSKLQKLENSSFQLYGVSDSDIGALEDRTLGAACGTVVMDMLQRTQNSLSGTGKIEKERIWESIVEANKIIRDKRNELGKDQMGTSFAALFLHGNRGLAVHLGDSRIYVIRGGRMLQITDDHLESSDMFRLGILSQAQAEVHKQTSRLTAYVGMDSIYDAHDEAFSKYFIFYPGDVFILCSDGISDAILNDEMERVTRLLKDASPDQIATTLMGAASEHSQEDKTIIVLHVDDAPGEAPKRGMATIPQKETYEKPQQAQEPRRMQFSQTAAPQQPVPQGEDEGYAEQPEAPVEEEPKKRSLLSFLNFNKEDNGEVEGEDGQESPSLLDQLLSNPKRLIIIAAAALLVLILLIVIISAIAKAGKGKQDNNSSGKSNVSSSEIESDSSESSSLPDETSSVPESSSEPSSEDSSEETSLPPQEETVREYTVVEGDSIYNIVLYSYGTADIELMQAFADYNGITLEEGIDIGQILLIPPLSELEK